LDRQPELYSYDGLAVEIKDTAKLKPLCGYGKFKVDHNLSINELPDSIGEIFREAIHKKTNIFRENDLVIYCEGKHRAILMYVDGHHLLSGLDKELLNVFTKNVVAAYENIELYERDQQQKDDLVSYLAELTGCRDTMVGRHTKRVAEISVKIGQLYGLSIEDVAALKMAAPLHYFGNLMVPEELLHKEVDLTEEESIELNSYITKGAELLSQADQRELKLAGEIAQDHLERWDGTGKPSGKKGDQINVMSRIVAIADVFDLLACKRSYREPWPLEDILTYFKDQKGKCFDPSLVDLLLENLDDFVAIRESMPDP